MNDFVIGAEIDLKTVVCYTAFRHNGKPFSPYYHIVTAVNQLGKRFFLLTIDGTILSSHKTFSDAESACPQDYWKIGTKEAGPLWGKT